MSLFTGFSFFGILANTSRLLGGIVLSTSIVIFKLLISSVPRLRGKKNTQYTDHSLVTWALSSLVCVCVFFFSHLSDSSYCVFCDILFSCTYWEE